MRQKYEEFYEILDEEIEISDDDFSWKMLPIKNFEVNYIK